MRHRTSLSTACGVSLIVVLAWSLASATSVLMAQATKAIREAKSYRFEMVIEADKPKPSTTTGTAYWMAPGSYRVEMFNGMQVDIKFRDKPGLGVNHQSKQYRVLPAQAGQQPGLMLLDQLGKYSGNADRQLGDKEINGIAAQGFEIAGKKIDSGITEGNVAIWIDKDTHLPVLVEQEMDFGEAVMKLTMHKFAWNIELDEKLFDTTPPAGYTEQERRDFTLADQTEKIVAGLRLYAEAFDGEYPRGKMVYGDVTSNALRKKMGITSKTPLDSKELAGYRVAQHGFAHMNMILRDNADSAYFGKTVTAKEGDKLLFYWKTDDGYQGIFGNLEAKSLSAEELEKIKR